MRARPRLLLLLIAYAAFISLGLPDAVTGVAWPSVRETFSLPQSGLGAILVGFGIGFFLSSSLTGRVVEGMGIGTLLAVSSGLVAISLFGYAATTAWPVFLLCALLVGMGSGAIDAGLNTYAARHFPVRHVNWLHACYGVGALIGPLVMTGVLTQGWSWRWGYAAIGTAILFMTAGFVATRSFWQTPEPSGAAATEARIRPSLALRHPLVWLQIGLFFTYTGLEVTVGQWCFTLYTEARAVPPDVAGIWTGLYWGSLAAGRFLLGFVVERLGPDRLLRIGTVSVVLGCLLFAFGSPLLSVLGLLLVGFSLAPIFPTLMARTPSRLGASYATHAVGFQVSAAMLGSAAVPSLTGVLAAHFGLEAVGLVAVVTAVVLGVLHEALLQRSSHDGVTS